MSIHGLPIADDVPPRRVPLFWKRVDRRGPDECWPWVGSHHRQGYGLFVKRGKRRGHLLAHRVAWFLEHGEPPYGLLVRHLCNNENCVNVAHLAIGTSLDNAQDRVRSGRQRWGEVSRNGKLKNDQVREIRRRYASGERICNLAREFGVRDPSISGIVHGRYWTRLN